jgi:hypothetical protein
MTASFRACEGSCAQRICTLTANAVCAGSFRTEVLQDDAGEVDSCQNRPNTGGPSILVSPSTEIMRVCQSTFVGIPKKLRTIDLVASASGRLSPGRLASARWARRPPDSRRDAGATFQAVYLRG